MRWQAVQVCEMEEKSIRCMLPNARNHAAPPPSSFLSQFFWFFLMILLTLFTFLSFGESAPRSAAQFLGGWLPWVLARRPVCCKCRCAGALAGAHRIPPPAPRPHAWPRT